MAVVVSVISFHFISLLSDDVMSQRIQLFGDNRDMVSRLPHLLLMELLFLSKNAQTQPVQLGARYFSFSNEQNQRICKSELPKLDRM